MVMMITVAVLRMRMMLQSAPYHVHLYTGESSDSGGEREGWLVERKGLCVCVCVCVIMRACCVGVRVR